MFTFGAGVMIGTPYQNAAGSVIATPSPVQFGVLQDVSIDESFEMKKLYGANKFPVALGQGKGSMMIKAKAANINAELFNAFMYGQTLTQTYENIYNDLTGTSIPTGEQVTPTINGTALLDLGVVSSINGAPFTRVATAPTSGQYGFSSGSGLYFFSALDYAKKAFINYAYGNAALTSAQQLIIQNQPMGQQPVFSLDFSAQYGGKTIYFHYPQVISSKVSRAFKNDDFTISDIDMEAFADASGNVCYQYFYE